MAATLRICRYVGNDARNFRELMQAFLSKDHTLSQRAAWALGHCGKQAPELVAGYTKQLLGKLKEPGIHDAVKRNTLRVWQYADLPERYEGEAFDLCYSYLRSPDEPPAIKAFAMTVMFNICRKHPGLKEELRLLLEEIVPYGKPAIRSRGTKILKALDKL